MHLRVGLISFLLVIAGVAQDFPPKPPLPPLAPMEPMIAAKIASVGYGFSWSGKGAPLSEEEQLKAMAIESLMQSDAARGIPLVDKMLQNTALSPGLRQRALSTLQMSNSTASRDVLVRVAKGERGADLQMRAVQQLASQRTKENRQVLGEIYNSSTDVGIRRQVLRGYMVAGEREPLLAVAKSDASAELRGEAVQLLGSMGADASLAELYAAEKDAQVKERILRGLASTGNSQKIVEIAKSEKDADLRERAIRQLSGMRSPSTQAELASLYASTSDVRTRSQILRSLASSGDPKPLIELARKETDPALKREAVQHLAHMKSKEAADFLMELLAK
ncbi:MAG: HEAT repeat domain-containing protein [Bryobacteraceae bacterium]|nr:HEAT repeat domain-containing protein [Bryobacteraceae bacterium]